MSSQLSDNDASICSTLNQRQRFLLLTSPPPRYTPLSPYPTFTKQQLDMRRKVEILQYKKNSTQDSQLTKSQRYSQIINASSKRGVICQNNTLAVSTSSASGVPGKPCYLQLDPKVPLYNYITGQDVYSEFTEPVLIPWGTHFTTGTNISINSANTLLFTMTVQDIKKAQYTFNLNVPIGIYVSGIKNSNVSDICGNVQISQATLNVYYYGSTTTDPYYTKTYTTSTIPHTTLFDVSCSFLSTSTAPFSGTQYMGNLSFPGIVLPTEYGFVYDFKLSFLLVNNTNTNYITNYSYGAYLNFPQYDTSANNCSVISQNPVIFGNYVPFTLNGT